MGLWNRWNVCTYLSRSAPSRRSFSLFSHLLQNCDTEKNNQYGWFAQSFRTCKQSCKLVLPQLFFPKNEERKRTSQVQVRNAIFYDFVLDFAQSLTTHRQSCWFWYQINPNLPTSEVKTFLAWIWNRKFCVFAIGCFVCLCFSSRSHSRRERGTPTHPLAHFCGI